MTTDPVTVAIGVLRAMDVQLRPDMVLIMTIETQEVRSPPTLVPALATGPSRFGGGDFPIADAGSSVVCAIIDLANLVSEQLKRLARGWQRNLVAL